MIRGALHEEVQVTQVVPPEAFAAAVTEYNNTTQGGASGIDLRGYDECVVELSIGDYAGGNYDVEFYDSATDDASAASQIDEADGTVGEFDTKTSANANGVYLARIRAKDVKRYLFIKTTNSSSDEKNIGINVLLGKADDIPVDQTNTVDFDHSDA